MRKVNVSTHKKIMAVSLVMVMVAGCLSGCAKKVDLTEDEQNLVAEYAAQVVLKHDKNYNGKLKEIDTEEVTSKNKETSTDNVNANTEQGTEPDSNIDLKSSLSDAFGFGALTVNYTGYQVLDTYPDTSDVAFVLKSTEDTRLLILKFNVSNQTGNAVDVPMMSFDTAIKSTINGSESYSALVTLLMDGLNTFSGTVAAGETKELVLAFQTPYSDENSISSLQLKVSKNGDSAIFDLK